MTELHHGLQFFCGTDEYHTIGIFMHVYATDGVNYLQEHGDCYWLPEAIASHLLAPKACQRKYGEAFASFHIWTLTPKGEGAILEARSDTHTPVLIRQEIEFTDFPFDNGQPFKFYAAPQQVGSRVVYILMLPQER